MANPFEIGRSEVGGPDLLGAPGADERQIYGPYDLDALSLQVHGRLINGLTLEIRRTLPDPLWNDVPRPEVTLEFDNTDGALTPWYLSNPRGQAVALSRYDVRSGRLAAKFDGQVQWPKLNEHTVTVECAVLDRAIFDELIPEPTVDTTTWPNAVDVGATIPVVFGNVPRMPCPNVCDDKVGSHFDYLIGHGTLAVTALARNGLNDSLYSITFSECVRAAGGAATSWSEVARTDLYPGYTVVRFALRQQDFNNALHKIYADVTGFATERNFAQAAASVLSNTTWGLGQTVNAASVTAAAAALPSALLCDGAMLAPRKARDVLAELFMVRGLRPDLNADGEITLTVDQSRNAVAMHISDDLGDGPRNRVKSGTRTGPPPEDRIKQFVIRYRKDFISGEYVLPVRRTVNADGGRKEKVQHNFIRDTATADRVVDYLAKTLKYGQETIDVTVTQEGRALNVGDLVMFTKASQGYSGDVLEITEIVERLTSLDLKLRGYHWSKYVYQAGTLPADAAAGSETDLSRTVPTTPTTPSISASGTRVAGDGRVTAWVTLASTVGTTNITAIRWRYRVNGTTPWIVGTTTTGTGAQTATIEGLQPNAAGSTSIQYDFSVEAVNAFGLVAASSNLSAQASAADSSVPSTPSAPTVTSPKPGTHVIIDASTRPADFAEMIVYSNTANSSTSPTPTEVTRTRSRTFVDHTQAYGSQRWFLTKHVDTSGNVSAFSPTGTSGSGGAPRAQGSGGNADIDTGSAGVGTTNVVTDAVTGKAKSTSISSTGDEDEPEKDITGASVTLTVSSTSSTIYITFDAQFQIQNNESHDSEYLFCLRLKRGSTTLKTIFIRDWIGDTRLTTRPVTINYPDDGVSGAQTYKVTVEGQTDTGDQVDFAIGPGAMIAIEQKR